MPAAHRDTSRTIGLSPMRSRDGDALVPGESNRRGTGVRHVSITSCGWKGERYDLGPLVSGSVGTGKAFEFPAVVGLSTVESVDE